MSTLNLPAIPFDHDEPTDKTVYVRVPRLVALDLAQQAKYASRLLGEYVSVNQLAASKLIAAIPACPIIPSPRHGGRAPGVLRQDTENS